MQLSREIAAGWSKPTREATAGATHRNYKSPAKSFRLSAPVLSMRLRVPEPDGSEPEARGLAEVEGSASRARLRVETDVGGSRLVPVCVRAIAVPYLTAAES